MDKIQNSYNWDSYQITKLENKHEISKKAKRDGMGDEPKSNSERFSVTENEIKLECDTYLEKHANGLREFLQKIEEKQNQLSGYLKQNHFQPIINRLEADFNTLANEKKIKLADHKNSYDTYLEEKNQFKRYHQISREPNSATLGTTFKAAGLIFFLLIIEVLANSTILSGSMPGGLAEGLAVSGSVAFINVFISAFIGFYVIKKFNHLEKPKRFFNMFLGSIYFVIISYINLSLGAYRSLAEKSLNAQITGKLDNEQINAILKQAVTPWNVEFSFVGLILTFVGLSFAFISIVDGLIYNDSYPGYGKVGQRVNQYKDLVKKIFHEYADEVSKLFSNYNQKLQEKLNELLNNDLNNWDANTNLIQKEFITYEAKVNDLEEKTLHMVDEYREENKRVRKSEPPKYFSKKFEINLDKKDPKKVFPDVAFHYMSDENREKSKLNYSNDIDQKFKKSEASCEQIQKKSEDLQKELHENYNV
tara:strand:- start:34 stop:1464 length:1431 start_codon:yes stop_codon:yes gene_type:complete